MQRRPYLPITTVLGTAVIQTIQTIQTIYMSILKPLHGVGGAVSIPSGGRPLGSDLLHAAVAISSWVLQPSINTP